ncbi:MAG: type II secretion system protein [Patescibacteria group bacterium]
MKHTKAFSLVELLIVVAIIGVLATIIMPAILGTRAKARDVRRKAEISQMGRLLSVSCFVPSAGSGDYDIAGIIDELKAANPRYASMIAEIPKDPGIGTDTQTHYRYIVDGSTRKCALYANFEGDSQVVTLSIVTATPGGGTGVFQSNTPGPNGGTRYYQVSSN